MVMVQVVSGYLVENASVVMFGGVSQATAEVGPAAACSTPKSNSADVAAAAVCWDEASEGQNTESKFVNRVRQSGS